MKNMQRKRKKIGIIFSFFAVAALALSGCSSGSDGATGPAGPAGPPGVPGTDAGTMTVAELGTALESSSVTVDSITIASRPVVKFTIKDAKGNGITGLNTYNTSAVPGLEYVKFNIAKLVPGANGSPSKWVNYIVTTAVAPPASPAYLYPAYESQGTLVDNGGGSYTYTFYRDLDKIKDTAHAEDVTYEPTRTHRLVIVVTPPEPPEPAKFWRCVNEVFDFTIDPATKKGIPLVAASERRDITTTAKCNSCHTDISKMFMNNAFNDGHHFDTRPDVRNCINCHTAQLGLVVKPDGTVVPGATSTNFAFAAPTESNRRLQPRIADGESLFDFPVMIHKLHMGNRLAKTGYNFDGVKFNEKVYTQDVTNCRKCHSESADTPQGDNWKNKPSRMACGSCHDGINWATGAGKTVKGATTGHVGGPATTDAFCAGCHNATSIDSVYHVTDNATPNNPNVPSGATNFIYEIKTVTVNASSQPVVTFRIKSYTGALTNAATATPVTFNNAAAATLLTGFTGSPSFLVTYADGTDSTIDYNNKGKLSFQPAAVSIDNVRKGTSGALTGPDADGYYVATLNQAAAGTTQASAFPAGAKLRAVALQGYFTQAAGTGGIAANLARHTPGVIKAVTGDAVRRTVVDNAKCANCHEWFEGHGGNRVYEMQMCLPCHVPNLSSSGRTVNLTRPEAAQNLKDMIHGIHAAGMRENPYKHSRAKSGSATIYDWSDVVFPAALKTCETCHKPGTYASVPSGALVTTNVITGDAAATYNEATSVVTSTDTIASYTALRDTGLANATDLVITPYAAACVWCHDSTSAKAHMEANGGAVNKRRSTVNAAIEQCAICHDAGRSADVTVVHK